MDEQMFCRPRGKMVPVVECATACASPADRPGCWLARGFAADYQAKLDAEQELPEPLVRTSPEGASLPDSRPINGTRGTPGDSTASGGSTKEEGS